ncbi:response regulator [Trichloromonas sp.]|uniref:response regulator n=1 Tax=Trichloromonas sp. TaxID=3069249 RepID=UPI003D8148A3
MTTRIACPKCQSRYRFDSSRASKPLIRIKCPGCGHAFQVDLAALKEPSLAACADEAAPGKAPGSKKILIVDDSNFFLELILDMLKSLEVEFLTASDGEEALQIIREQKPALVLLDLNLPRKNGYELIREVREDLELRQVRLLAMSGVFRKNDDINEVYRGGADDFISKSFKPEQLLERVNKLLEG